MFLKVLVMFLAVTSDSASSTDYGLCVDYLEEISAIKVDPSESTLVGMYTTECGYNDLVQLYSVDNLTEVDRLLCEKRYQEFEAAADNLTLYDRFLLYVNYNDGIKCILCQHKVIKFPWTRSFVEDVTASEFFVVVLTSTDNRESDYLTEEAKNTLIGNLASLLGECGRPQMKHNRSWLDEAGRLNAEFYVHTNIATSVNIGDKTTSVINGTYLMRVDDVGSCPAGETVDADGVLMAWPKSATEGNDVITTYRNATTGAIIRRHCDFNFTSFQAEWDPKLSNWEINWRPCESSDELYVNEEHYEQFLDPDIQRRHANELHDYTLAPVNTTTLQEIAAIVSREVEVRNELYEQKWRDLVSITANLVTGSDYLMAVAFRSYLIVTDLKGSDQPIGFSLAYSAVFENTSQDIVTLNRKQTVGRRAPFALDLSAWLVEAHTRMAFVVLWKSVLQNYDSDPHVDFRSKEYLEVTVMFPVQGEVSIWTFQSYANHYVDITYDFVEMNKFHKPNFGYRYNFVACLAWNHDLSDWSSKGCAMLYSNKGNFSACRCSAKYFSLKDGVPVAKYALKKGFAWNDKAIANSPFTEFLKDKTGVMSATVIECLLAALSLGALICTAVLFEFWRENKGNKILLHMVLALTCNLLLGFSINFVRMTTESFGCLIYGVLRHYSFLAMFFWMLVLSLLQLKRLTTMVGAKTTSHLILKVSAFAWGMPLVPITILLGCNPGFYQTDRFDRGYCYPEGLVFHVTVQGPAAAILLVNLGIFVKIVLHIFECDGEEKITRHSKVERAEQLNKLKTAFFIFFLFGFSWVFHILSEQRVIVSDFLYEYLFLMTATTHISVLALFFVILHERTRKEWGKVSSSIFSKVHIKN